MARTIMSTAVLPAGFSLVSVEVAGDRAVITVRPTCAEARCPGCGVPAHRIHSRYARTWAVGPQRGSPRA